MGDDFGDGRIFLAKPREGVLAPKSDCVIKAVDTEKPAAVVAASGF